MLEDGQEPIKEAMFAIRSAYHDDYNPSNTPNFQYPAGYDAPWKFTRLIQELRSKKLADKVAASAALNAPPVVPKKEKVSIVIPWVYHRL